MTKPENPFIFDIKDNPSRLTASLEIDTSKMSWQEVQRVALNLSKEIGKPIVLCTRQQEK